MASKRGTSGLSLVVPVNKPTGMTSHDVVNRCRRIFGERRVGHTGTLDPLATGVLPICVGPATRLDRFLTSHEKRYRVTIGFGFETETDDIEGAPTTRGSVGGDMLDGAFAEAYVAGLVGKHMQVPPRYSAIKKDGKKAYELARAGVDVELEARPIEVFESVLVDRFEEDGMLRWVVDFSVSKGTYIRSLVRDIGRELGARAHVVALERRQSGLLSLDECVSLESLESLGAEAAIDPVRLLGFRVLFADDCEKAVCNGGKLSAVRSVLFEPEGCACRDEHCACTNSLVESTRPLEDGEHVSVILANRLKAIYRFDAESGALKPDCLFSIGVSRG